MKTEAVIEFYGGTQQKTADALGLHQTTICGWGEFPPALRQIQIERMSGGKLKAEPECFEVKKAAA